MVDAQPVDYTSKDYAGLRQAMLDDALSKLPEWTSRDPNDFGVVLIEQFAYMGDILSYYIDRVANESYLPTATLRQSLLNISAAYDYRPDNGQPSQVLLSVGVVPGAGQVFVPAGTQFGATDSGSDAAFVIFETVDDLYIDQDATTVATKTVTAVQGETTAGESVGSSDGTANQILPLANAPVIEGSVEVWVDEGASGPSLWNFVEYLIDTGPGSAVFTTTTDAAGVTSIVFGDGVNGRVPVVDAVITATYRVGGGTAGNVGAGSVTQIISAPSGVASVNNEGAAEGGTDPETNDQIRVNAPRSLSTLHRAVSLQDYANLCLMVAGVAKANAAGLTYTAITVYVAPPGGGTASGTVKSRTLSYLSDKQMVNAHVTLEDPIYVPINIAADIEVADQYAQATVIAACRNALMTLLDFDNVDFAQKITRSDVYRALTAVPGVMHADLTVLARMTDVVQGLGDIQTAANEIPTSTGAVLVVTATDGGITEASGGASGGGVSVLPGVPGRPIIDSSSGAGGGPYSFQIHWDAATDAVYYAVIIDLFVGDTYLGSVKAGVFSGTTATVSGTSPANSWQLHIQAINGLNVTDGPPNLVSVVHPG